MKYAKLFTLFLISSLTLASPLNAIFTTKGRRTNQTANEPATANQAFLGKRFFKTQQSQHSSSRWQRMSGAALGGTAVVKQAIFQHVLA